MLRMRDFLGREIQEGMWLACSGGGNRYREYGQILYRVVRSTDTRLEVARLRCDKWRVGAGEPRAGTPGLDWRLAKSLVRKPTKYVIVDPPANVVRLYESIAGGNYTTEQHQTALKWLHGDEVEF